MTFSCMNCLSLLSFLPSLFAFFPMANSRDTERKINENISKASGAAQDEVSRLRSELDDLRRRAGPKVEEAESFLTTPAAFGFYKGMPCLYSL